MINISVPAPKAENSDRDLYSGLIRLHILHHAVEAPIFGLGMVEELARHRYGISPGTLYPLLHGLEQKGYLRSWEECNGLSRRRVFRATPKGKLALLAAKIVACPQRRFWGKCSASEIVVVFSYCRIRLKEPR